MRWGMCEWEVERRTECGGTETGTASLRHLLSQSADNDSDLVNNNHNVKHRKYSPSQTGSQEIF